MPEYYRADDVPVPGTLARAAEETARIRKMVESFELIPTERQLKEGTAIDRTARIGQDAQTWDLED